MQEALLEDNMVLQAAGLLASKDPTSGSEPHIMARHTDWLVVPHHKGWAPLAYQALDASLQASQELPLVVTLEAELQEPSTVATFTAALLIAFIVAFIVLTIGADAHQSLFGSRQAISSSEGGFQQICPYDEAHAIFPSPELLTL